MNSLLFFPQNLLMTRHYFSLLRAHCTAAAFCHLRIEIKIELHLRCTFIARIKLCSYIVFKLTIIASIASCFYYSSIYYEEIMNHFSVLVMFKIKILTSKGYRTAMAYPIEGIFAWNKHGFHSDVDCITNCIHDWENVDLVLISVALPIWSLQNQVDNWSFCESHFDIVDVNQI